MTPPTPTPNAEQLEKLSHLSECVTILDRLSYSPVPNCLLLRDVATDLRNIHAGISSLLTAHAKELAELRERLDYQHQLGRNIAEERDTLRAQLTDSQKLLRAADAELEGLRTFLADSQKRVEALEAQIAAVDDLPYPPEAEQEIETLTKRVMELEGLLDRSYDELKNMRHKLWHGEAPGTEGEQRRSVLMGNIEAARQSPKQEGM